MSLLEQNTTKKKVDNNNMVKLDTNNNKNREQKVKTIQDSTVSIKELISYLLERYYLVFQKKYSEKKIT